MLHRVVPDTCNSLLNPLCRNLSIAVSLQSLERVIRFFLSREYDFISLNQVEERLNTPAKKKFIAFTFDDGYLDNFLYAYPLLHKYKIPFAIYLTTGLPDYTQSLWWFYLEDWIEAGKPINFEFVGQRFAFSCEKDDDKRNAINSLGLFLETSSPEVLDRFLREILEPRFGDPFTKTRIFSLNWPQIRLLSQDPLVTIASHGTFHNNLTCLTHTQLEDNLSRAKTRIEDEIGRSVEHFAYPFGHVGSFNEDVVQVLTKVGYRTATTTLHGTLNRKHCKYILYLPRISLNCKSEPWLELLCCGLPRRLYI